MTGVPGRRLAGALRGARLVLRPLSAALVLAGVAATPAGVALLAPAPAHASASESTLPVAGAFVYPIGNELDFRRPAPEGGTGYRVTGPYEESRGNGEKRHQGVDLSNSQGGAAVRAVASGVVLVADRNARIKIRTKETVKVRKKVKGKRVTRTVTRWRTSYRWRTGWGNYVVIRHVLPRGETVYSLYAHLQSGSVRVGPGEVVAAGETIARVGNTGRASSPHLHLEIRRNASSNRANGPVLPETVSTPEERTFALLETMDPVAFLESHVRRYEDLAPGSWQARYALAATRDGLAGADSKRFQPDQAVSRADYYHALAAAFRLGSAFAPGDFESSVNALATAGILDGSAARRHTPDEPVSRSEALELLLRCLDGQEVHAWTLAALDPLQTARDFNVRFAGNMAAKRVEREAKAAAARETEKRRAAETLRVTKARKAAAAKGKKSRVTRKPVKPVAPVPILDPGFEALSRSEKSLSRAECCLLLASALRPGSERYSALQRAAIRLAQSN